MTVLRDNLCWKEKTIDIEVINENIGSLNFQQTGYILKCTISHAVSLVSISVVMESLQSSLG